MEEGFIRAGVLISWGKVLRDGVFGWDLADMGFGVLRFSNLGIIRVFGFWE